MRALVASTAGGGGRHPARAIIASAPRCCCIATWSAADGGAPGDALRPRPGAGVRLQPGGAAPARAGVKAAGEAAAGDPFRRPSRRWNARIANAVLPAGEVVNHARRVAERFNALPPGAVRESKALLRRAGTDDVLKTIAREGEMFVARPAQPGGDGGLEGPSRSASQISPSSPEARRSARMLAGLKALLIPPLLVAQGAGRRGAARACPRLRVRAMAKWATGPLLRSADRRRFVGGRRGRGHAGRRRSPGSSRATGALRGRSAT